MKSKLFLFVAVAAISYFATTYNSQSIVTIVTPDGAARLPLISFVIILVVGMFLITILDNVINWAPEKLSAIQNDKLIKNLRKKIEDLESGIKHFLQGTYVDSHKNLQLISNSQQYLQGNLTLKVPDMIFLLGNLLHYQYKPLHSDNDFLFMLETATVHAASDYKSLVALLIKKDIKRLYKLYQSQLISFLVKAIPCLHPDQSYQLLKACPKELQNNIQIQILYLTNLAKHNKLIEYEPKIKKYLDSQDTVALMGLIWPIEEIDKAIGYLNKKKVRHPAYQLALARLFYRAENYNQSIVYYAKVHDVYLLDPKVCVEIALAYHANGQYDKARYWCENIWKE